MSAFLMGGGQDVSCLSGSHTFRPIRRLWLLWTLAGVCCVLILTRISSSWAFLKPWVTGATRRPAVPRKLPQRCRWFCATGTCWRQEQGHSSACYLLLGVLPSEAAQQSSVHHPQTSRWHHLSHHEFTWWRNVWGWSQYSLKMWSLELGDTGRVVTSSKIQYSNVDYLWSSVVESWKEPGKEPELIWC